MTGHNQKTSVYLKLAKCYIGQTSNGVKTKKDYNPPTTSSHSPKGERAPCCTILGEELDSKKNWVTNVRKNGKVWIPMFLEYVDPEKCIGCGLCVKVCTGRCYQMQEIKGKKIAVATHPENCLGDCSCHLICPVQGGAMVCKPKLKGKE